MLNTIISIFTSIVIFFCTLFGINLGGTEPTGYDMYSDIAYGQDAEQVFDLIIPQGVGNEMGLCVYIHGGGWIGGDKSAESETVKPFAKKGLVTANVNYRLLKDGHDELNYKSLLEDINEAVKKIVSFCEEKGISVKKAMFMGESAGGHIALMYSYTYYDKCPVEIGFVYSICGPTDMTDERYFVDTDFPEDMMLNIQTLLTGKTVTADNRFSDEIVQAQLEVSPISYVNENSVPTILNSCGQDRLVPVSNAETLCDVLEANGVEYYYKEFYFSNHCGRHGMDFINYTLLDMKLDEMIEKYVKQ